MTKESADQVVKRDDILQYNGDVVVGKASHSPPWNFMMACAFTEHWDDGVV